MDILGVWSKKGGGDKPFRVYPSGGLCYYLHPPAKVAEDPFHTMVYIIYNLVIWALYSRMSGEFIAENVNYLVITK